MDKKKVENVKWCPTQAGNFTAYVPEFLEDGEWKRIPTVRAKPDMGIPSPVAFRGILDVMDMLGYEQAQAIAWSYAARCVSILGMQTPIMRIQTYDVVFEIKAKKGVALQVLA